MEQCEALYGSKGFCLAECKRRAQGGDAIWQREYARILFDIGIYYHKDIHATAEGWFNRAARQLDAKAQMILAGIYDDKTGSMHWDGSKRNEKTVYWYMAAAKQGSVNACYWLANCFDYGLYEMQVDTDAAARWYKTALSYYEEAVDKGDVDAMCELGECYLDGAGVERNIEKAISLYRLAANSGDARAQRMLGTFYKYGRGVEKSQTDAAMWFAKSRATYKEAAALYGQLAQKERDMASSSVNVADIDWRADDLWYEKALQSNYARLLQRHYEVLEREYAGYAKWNPRNDITADQYASTYCAQRIEAQL